MFGERLRKANRIARHRLNRERQHYLFSGSWTVDPRILARQSYPGLYPIWVGRIVRAGYHRKSGNVIFGHGRTCSGVGYCDRCDSDYKRKGSRKMRNFWVRDIDEQFAWPQTPVPCGERE